jgi:hypothetical protein
MKALMTFKAFLMFLIICLFIVNDVTGTGILYVRPRWSSNPYEKVWIKSIDVDATIQDQVAVTHVDQVFFNELNTTAEAVYIFPLPENAMITELVYWVNGQRFEAEIRERQEAIDDYNQKLREWLDPALLEYLGDNIDKSLLTRLSLDNHGYATFITSDDSIAILIANHFNRISKPVMTNLNLDYGGLQVWDQYPKTILDLYWGSNTMEMGLYNGSGDYIVTLTGRIRGESMEMPQLKTFRGESGGYRFVPRLWARGKIDHLLDLISIYGETDELVEQVIQLSLTFQILTPYTALYVDPTDINKEPKVAPGAFKLFANYPNPFNPETTIRYHLPADQSTYRVIIKIYDILGQLIITLRDEQQGPGNYQITWDGRNAAGKEVPSGVYFLTLEAGKYKATQKMMLVR